MKAEAVFIVLVVLSALISLSFIWGLILVKKMRLITQGSEAVKAFYAADSGLECELYKIYIDASEICPPNLTNQTSVVLKEESLPSGGLVIKAKGYTTDSQVYRTLQIKL